MTAVNGISEILVPGSKFFCIYCVRMTFIMKIYSNTP